MVACSVGSSCPGRVGTWRRFIPILLQVAGRFGNVANRPKARLPPGIMSAKITGHQAQVLPAATIFIGEFSGMKSQARAVVIGGGVVGVSTLYHLAKKGWTDAVLIERKELTSGSTWHAAGLLPLFNMSYSVGQIHKYSVRFYQELQQETGMNVGFTNCTNIRLARTSDRWDEFMYYAGIAETI